MTEDQLKKLVAYYQQKHADAVLEGAQHRVLYESAVEENGKLTERVRELEAVKPAK